MKPRQVICQLALDLIKLGYGELTTELLRAGANHSDGQLSTLIETLHNATKAFMEEQFKRRTDGPKCG